MSTSAAEASKLKRRLRHAVAVNGFEVHYQPQLWIATGELHGVEALLRWRSRSGHWISPADFTPMLEKMGLIGAVGRSVVQRALADYEYWKSRGRCVRRVAVNVSPTQLHSRESLAEILDLCSSWKADDAQLDIELTESALVPDSAEFIHFLEQLARRGVTVALDDFGAGYSCLRLLGSLPLRFLKIDRSLICEIAHSRRASIVVENVIRLARELGMRTIAEGVETQDQLFLLRKLGCDIAQGYLFSRALPPGELLRYLPMLSATEASTNHEHDLLLACAQ